MDRELEALLAMTGQTDRTKRTDQVAEELGSAFVEPPPQRSPRRQKAMPWQPKLGPIGREILLNRKDKTKFLYGERGSLKTGICLHDLIVHCYQDFAPGCMSPLAVICTIIRSSATEGGAWEKLNTMYLQEWFNGIGLEFTEPRMDDQKNRYIFIANKAGGWSRVVLKSIPHGESIRGRLKGIEPSYFLFDEITEADNPDYYIIPSQSLRRPTGGPRQFTGAGNPPEEGEEHWTWKVLCQRKVEGKVVNPQIPPGGGRLTGTPDQIAAYHVPLSENVYWSDQEKKDYQATLMQEAVLDPTAEDRIIKGLWTARPKGQGLFKEFFIENIHIKGDAIRGRGLKPVSGFPIILGYDLGQVYNSIHFEQLLPISDGKAVWIIFDEVVHLNEKLLYKKLAWEVIGKMRRWRSLMDYDFQYMHITDSSAVNQWRPGHGSYDALDFEKEYNRSAESLGARKMKLLECPKGEGSVEARVRLFQGKLYQEEVFISATCQYTREMVLRLESDKNNPGKPRHDKYSHIFDSATYPMFKLELGGGVKKVLPTGQVAPSLLRCGGS